jgi:hypothetical protein
MPKLIAVSQHLPSSSSFFHHHHHHHHHHQQQQWLLATPTLTPTPMLSTGTDTHQQTHAAQMTQSSFGPSWAFFSFISVFYKLTNCSLFIFQVPKYWITRTYWITRDRTMGVCHVCFKFFFSCFFYKFTKHVAFCFLGCNVLIMSNINPTPTLQLCHVNHPPPASQATACGVDSEWMMMGKGKGRQGMQRWARGRWWTREMQHSNRDATQWMATIPTTPTSHILTRLLGLMLD